MDYYNESGCYSFQLMNASNRIVFEPQLIVSSSPLVSSRINRTRVYSRLAESNTKTTGLSLKSLLKSKLFAKRNNMNHKSAHLNTVNWSSFSLYDKISHPTPTLREQLCKIMDKSIGWLRTKKLKSAAKQRKLKKNAHTRQEELIYENLTMPEEYQPYQTYQCIISTPVRVSQHSFQPPDSFVSSPIELNDECVSHSTPYSTRVYSPCCPRDSFNSSSSSCYSSSRSFTRSRVVFGMTSSPNTSLNEFDEHNELDESAILANNGLIEPSLTNQINEFSCLDAKEKLLVERLNLIKENVRRGYEMRLTTVKRTRHLVEQESQREEENCVSVSAVSSKTQNLTSKKRKLQSIFQTKLQRQLREVKKWQFNFRKSSAQNKTSNLSTSTKRFECGNHASSQLQVCHQCNCRNLYYF